MDAQQVLRWLTVAIVMMLAVVVLSFVLKFAGFLLGYAIKILVILLVVAIALRFFTLLQERRP